MQAVPLILSDEAVVVVIDTATRERDVLRITLHFWLSQILISLELSFFVVCSILFHSHSICFHLTWINQQFKLFYCVCILNCPVLIHKIVFSLVVPFRNFLVLRTLKLKTLYKTLATFSSIVESLKSEIFKGEFLVLVWTKKQNSLPWNTKKMYIFSPGLQSQFIHILLIGGK